MASDATLAVKDHKNRNKNAEANERMVYRKGLTDAEQLTRLDNRLGTGIGAGRERAKLIYRITHTTDGRDPRGGGKRPRRS
jgi:hypothetical protein